MLDSSQLRDDANRLSVEILRTDVDLALTFTSIVQNRVDREAVGQSVRHARKAYDFVLRKRTEVPISNADATELDKKLAILRKRLEDLGEKF